MTDTPPLPQVTANGPFNRITILQNSSGATILDNVLGTIFLGILALALLYQLARMYDQNRQLARRCQESGQKAA